MDAIKEYLNAWARPLLAKWITRAILYGAGALFVSWGVAAPKDDAIAAVADYAAAAACAGAALLIDYLHHRKDLAQVPPKK